ncbi:MAG: putative hydroxymethylpyrimidine transporter CytX [Oscillospiraceae bacterium]
MKKTTILSNSLIWFGAGVSIAEILTGTLIAPLGFSKGFAAIILGHLIGCALLYFAGLIGAKTEKSAMETVKLSFGQKGSLLFSSLNVLQLVGWTAIMIVNGAAAASLIVSAGGAWVWTLAIGALVIVWVLVGSKILDKINIIAMSGLFILTVILSMVVFRGNGASAIFENGISFGSAVELSVAMPLSWLPLISDYTRNAQKPKATTLVSVIVYFFVSCWMYVIGMGASLFTGESDIAKIMMGAGLGTIGLVIVIFSTVTTTYLDVYSAGVSAESIWKKLKEKPVAAGVCVVGILLAIFTRVTELESFLYLIGSVFAPMIAILITDFFILKNDYTDKKVDVKNIIIWAVGFVIYRLFMKIDTPIGNTAPVMVITALICVVVNVIMKKVSKSKKA